MPSSYTPSLRLLLPVTGELTGTWGDAVNQGITELIEDAIAGTAAIAMANANVTLTTVNENVDQARNMFLNLTGANTAQRDVIVPAVSKLYFVHNGTTGGFGVLVRTPSGAGVVVPNGHRVALYCNGVDVLLAIGTAFGNNLLHAADIAAALAVLGATATGSALFTAANQTAARSAAGADITPRNDAAFVTGHMRVITGGVTIATGTADHVFTVFNNTSAAVALNQGSGLTLRLSGTDLTGNRTLLPYGIAVVNYISNTVAVISGDVT